MAKDNKKKLSVCKHLKASVENLPSILIQQSLSTEFMYVSVPL